MFNCLHTSHQVHLYRRLREEKRRKAGLPVSLIPYELVCPETDRCGSLVSRWDKLLIFGGCNLAALACFVICFALFPVLTLRPRKFAILYYTPPFSFALSLHPQDLDTLACDNFYIP